MSEHPADEQHPGSPKADSPWRGLAPHEVLEQLNHRSAAPVGNVAGQPAEELSTATERDLLPHGGEVDLREHYITPDYLATMEQRSREWSAEQVKQQAALFRRTIPDYPEVAETLEGELHARNLNKLVRHLRKCNDAEMQALLEKYGSEPDYREIIETEIEIRSGSKHLFDASGET